MLEILTDLTAGTGQDGDIERLEETCAAMKEAALCGLGKTTYRPVLSTIRYFRSEYDAHIKGKTCPAGICPELTVFAIDEKACSGCGVCAKHCLVSAIAASKKGGLHAIDARECISYGSCRPACKFGAIRAERRQPECRN